MQPTHPQYPPAQALAALLAEHPELPELFWSVIPDSDSVSGGLYEPQLDARYAGLRFASVLTITDVYERWRAAREDEQGTERYTVNLYGTWRGVQFSLSLGCDAAAVQIGRQLLRSTAEIVPLERRRAVAA
ncbi:hypothetical protein [Streptomyces chumphonensis]|uniref:hypothetical protein n=1 Tax=Streptomyces chumphonensis TaxID=1214925 RepID=UPI003D72B958